MIPKIKVTVITRRPFFELYLIHCLIKLYFKIIFWITLAIKYEKKKSLFGENISVLLKGLKNKLIVIPMHHFVIRLPLEPYYLPKRSNLMQNNFWTWKYNFHINFCLGIHQQIRILRFHSNNLFCNRPFNLKFNLKK